jgi:hypothetical protein
MFKSELCLLINKRNAERTSSYPILPYFTGFFYNKDIFPESITVAANGKWTVRGRRRKIETTFLDLIFWFMPTLYDERNLALLCYWVKMAVILNQMCAVWTDRAHGERRIKTSNYRSSAYNLMQVTSPSHMAFLYGRGTYYELAKNAFLMLQRETGHCTCNLITQETEF